MSKMKLFVCQFCRAVHGDETDTNPVDARISSFASIATNES